MIRDNLTVRQRRAFSCFPLETGKPLDVCIVQDCWRKTRADQSLCARHIMQKWRRDHPETAQYARLKAKARKRRKVFDITREEWSELCRLTRYHEGTASKAGSVRESLTIDHIRAEGGYTLDNIRVLVQHENARKGSYEMQCRLKSGKHILLRGDCVSVTEQLQADAPEDLETILERI